MKEFRAKMSGNGRIVISVFCREQLHLETGDDLIIHLDKEEIRIYSAKHSLEKARAQIKKYAKNKDLITQLKRPRKEHVLH